MTSEWYAAHKDTEQYKESKRVAARKYWAAHPKTEEQKAARKLYSVEYAAKNPDKITAIKRKATLAQYDLTTEQYDEMLGSQGNCCGICGKPSTRRLAVDHDHSTGKVRGLLCFKCNTTLGHVDDSVELLERFVAYLKS